MFEPFQLDKFGVEIMVVTKSLISVAIIAAGLPERIRK
jgi:hypothetical protein